ncbi:MAG TPA: type III-B CRISPR module RAMP protein Cmr6 [Alphaproteobacteria bacterium]|nr:type III-B CRISPR module RAMP protein Cmr6 [Alphaproteobacteria bacterium]
MLRGPQRASHRPGPPSRPTTVDYPLPKETRLLARSQGGHCCNLGLWLDRFALYEQRGTTWELTPQAKRREDAPLNLQAIKPLLEACIARWKAMLDSYRHQGFQVEQLTATPDWRIIVGLGAAHVLETSITLHRVYGFPWIPGSGLKGMTRAYAGLVLDKSERDDDFRRIFGSQQEGKEQAGEVIFLDAIPAQVPRFKLEVMNPHYGEYYRGGSTPPADWLSPVPVYFLTVERTPFLFALAARRKEANGLVGAAAQWLQAALSELGIGGKTAAGYGFFV